MHIFVINLKGHASRRAAIAKQLDQLGLNYEIFAAINGKTLPPTELDSYTDGRGFRRYEGREAEPGEVGCALSHIEIYRLIVERRLPYALILEDDAWLNPNLENLLSSIEQTYSPGEKNVFLLTWVISFSHGNYQKLWSHYSVVDVKSAVCTHGYVISNSAAVSLIDKLYPVRHVADCWNWLIRHRVVRIRAISPTCITADLSFDSTMKPEHIEKRSRMSWLERAFRKITRAYWFCVDHLNAFKSRISDMF